MVILEFRNVPDIDEPSLEKVTSSPSMLADTPSGRSILWVMLSLRHMYHLSENIRKKASSNTLLLGVMMIHDSLICRND